MPPTNTVLKWYKDSISTATLYATPAAAKTGLYFAAFKDTVLNCISVGTPVGVAISDCNVCDNTNLIFNGDFEGGKMGFDHNYVFQATTPLVNLSDANTGHITLLDDTDAKLHAQFVFWATPADHTTSCVDGQYLFVQGGENTVPANQTVWKQTVKGLKVGTKYTFSYYAADNVMNFVSPVSYPGHSATIDGVVAIRQDTFPFLTKPL